MVAGLILASGMSRRFGEENKLLVELGGIPVIRHTVAAYAKADLRPLVVVVGHDAERVAAALGGLGLTLVPNPDFDQGQSRALVRGVRALPPETAAAVIGVADQPYLNAGLIRALVERHTESGAPLVVPRYGGRRGNPVLFSAALFSELLEVEGDRGGRPVILAHAGEITWLDVPDVMPGLDLDTPADLRAMRMLHGGKEQRRTE